MHKLSNLEAVQLTKDYTNYNASVVFLAIMKIKLVDACACIYCYVMNLPAGIYMCALLYIHIDSALWQTIYITSIDYCNYTKSGVLLMSVWYYIILVTSSF